MTSFLLIATMLFQGSPTILQTIAGACLCENLGKCSVQCQGTSPILKNTHRHGMHSFTNKQTNRKQNKIKKNKKTFYYIKYAKTESPAALHTKQ